MIGVSKSYDIYKTITYLNQTYWHGKNMSISLEICQCKGDLVEGCANAPRHSIRAKTVLRRLTGKGRAREEAARLDTHKVHTCYNCRARAERSSHYKANLTTIVVIA